MRPFLSALPLVLLASPALAQVDDDTELWLATSASVGIADGTKLSGEVTARFSGDDDGLYEIEMVAMLGHAVTDRVEIAAGYVRTPAYSGGSVTRIENRARQQITVKLGKLAGGSLSGRVRFEERFRAGESQVGVRVRPYLKLTLPLGESAPSLFVAHESFVNLNDTRWGQRGGHERMRNQIALSMPVATGLTVDAGYLNQYRFGAGAAPDEMDHAATVTLSLSL